MRKSAQLTPVILAARNTPHRTVPFEDVRLMSVRSSRRDAVVRWTTYFQRCSDEIVSVRVGQLARLLHDPLDGRRAQVHLGAGRAGGHDGRREGDGQVQMSRSLVITLCYCPVEVGSEVMSWQVAKVSHVDVLACNMSLVDVGLNSMPCMGYSLQQALCLCVSFTRLHQRDMTLLPTHHRSPRPYPPLRLFP